MTPIDLILLKQKLEKELTNKMLEFDHGCKDEYFSIGDFNFRIEVFSKDYNNTILNLVYMGDDELITCYFNYNKSTWINENQKIIRLGTLSYTRLRYYDHNPFPELINHLIKRSLEEEEEN